MSSLPKRAKFYNIIQDLFQNEIIEGEEFKQYYTFSDIHLTDEQQKLLSYPQGFIPMNIFVLQQVDSLVGQNTSFSQSIVSFVKKSDGFVYGYYFDLTDGQKFDRKVLIKSLKPIQLEPSVKLQSINLLEVYNNVNSLTQILSLGNGFATLQYSKDNMYYYESLNVNGILSPSGPGTKLIGLSKNLNRYTSQCHA